jgi:hypothetical protein
MLAIKLNNCASNDPCAICGDRCDPQVGPEIFLADTWALVCRPCAQRIAPALLLCLEAGRAEAERLGLHDLLQGQDEVRRPLA